MRYYLSLACHPSACHTAANVDSFATSSMLNLELKLHLSAVYELWSGQIAFTGLSKIQVMAGVVNSGLRPSFPCNCPTWYSTLAVACWAQSPAAR